MIFLSIDTEEFDDPKKYNNNYDPIINGMPISLFGINRILDILESENISATFFCTSNFAENAPHIIKRIVNNGSEIASHGCNHFCPEKDDIVHSKVILESLSGEKVYGYRSPRMQTANVKLLKDAGYIYDASVNPTYIPHRYNNLNRPRLPFINDGIVEIPSSVTPTFRIPLFWFTLHLLPSKIYSRICSYTHKKDKNINVYFHPWEFYPMSSICNFNVPALTAFNSGDVMCNRFKCFIRQMKRSGITFGTYYQYAQMVRHKL